MSYFTVDEMYEVELPAAIHAERTILGSILIDSAYYKKVAGRLDADDFSLDSHKIIFTRMVELFAQGSAVDIVTLIDCLERHKEREMVGGGAYIFSLTEMLPHRISLKDYMLIVREKRRLRGIITACQYAIKCVSENLPSSDIANDLIRDINLQIEEKKA